MIHPDDAHCYPVCNTCRVADVCHKGPSAEVLRRENPPPVWAPNRLPYVKLECGCTGIPWPIVKILGVEWIECPTHGRVHEEKPKKKRKARGEIPGQMDIPPF
jgi:hypothetical protein